MAKQKQAAEIKLTEAVTEVEGVKLYAIPFESEAKRRSATALWPTLNKTGSNHHVVECEGEDWHIFMRVYGPRGSDKPVPPGVAFVGLRVDTPAAQVAAPAADLAAAIVAGKITAKQAETLAKLLGKLQ